MQFAHAVGRVRRFERENGHAKFLVVVAWDHAAKREQPVSADIELAGQMPHRVIHQLPPKTIMPGRHRRVRREQALLLHRSQRNVKTGPVGDLFAHQFQREKCRVTFVHVKH